MNNLFKQLKKQQKFSDKVVEMSMQVEGTKTPMHLSEVWRWIKGLLYDFMALKKDKVELEKLNLQMRLNILKERPQFNDITNFDLPLQISSHDHATDHFDSINYPELKMNNQNSSLPSLMSRNDLDSSLQRRVEKQHPQHIRLHREESDHSKD